VNKRSGRREKRELRKNKGALTAQKRERNRRKGIKAKKK
jgi:hypothetical protein